MELPGYWTLDWGLRYIDKLPSLNVQDYLTLDVRLGWKLNENLEVSIVGQNLLHGHHAEFSPLLLNTPRTEVERGLYGTATWRY